MPLDINLKNIETSHQPQTEQ